jgi:hypothetical protein
VIRTASLKMLSLVDLSVMRQSELTRILAGCAAIDPMIVLPMIDGIKAEDLTDERGRIYLLQLRERLPEIQKASDDESAGIRVEVAFSNNFQADYYKWLLLATEEEITAGELAARCIQQIKRLVVLRDGIEDLQDYAARLILEHGWGNAKEREEEAKKIYG